MPVSATPAALEALARLRAAHGPLLLFQSGGCCDGSAPICIEAGELPIAPSDVLLGAVGDIPFYIDGEQCERRRRGGDLVEHGRCLGATRRIRASSGYS